MAEAMTDELLEKIRAAYGQYPETTVMALVVEVDRLRAEVAALTRQRDEAKKQAFSGHDWNRLLGERDAARAEGEALRGALREAVPPSDDWWCPTCQVALGGSRVTNDERCDTCGTPLDYQTPEWIARARALSGPSATTGGGEPSHG